MRTLDRTEASPARLTLRVLSFAAHTVLAVLAIAAVAIIGPRVAGYIPLTVLTGSMQPAFAAGDLAYTKPVASADELAVGDVVAFHPYSDNPTLIIHRIIDVTESGFITRGDANGADDPEIVPGQVAGKMHFVVPLLGHVQQWLLPWGVAAAMLAMLWIYFAPSGRPSARTTQEATDAE